MTADAANAFINGNRQKTLGVINPNQILNWEVVKGKPKWVNVT